MFRKATDLKEIMRNLPWRWFPSTPCAKSTTNHRARQSSDRIKSATVVRSIAILTAMTLCIPAVPAYGQCGGTSATAPITVDDESASISDARMLVNGSNTTVDTSTPGQISITANNPNPLTINTYSGGGTFAPLANTFTRVTSATGVSLPATSAVAVGSVISMTIGGAQGATVVNTSSGAGDSIIFNGSTSNSSITINNGDEITLANQGSGTWLVTSFLPQGGSTGSQWTLLQGGTGASTASAARTNLGAAGRGANSDITSLTGLTTALPASEGGTGSTTVPSNGQIPVGNGSSYTPATISAGTGVSVVNGSGSVSVGLTPGFSGTSTRNVGVWAPILTTSTTFTAVGITAPTVNTAGTVANNSGASGIMIKYPTTAVSANAAGVHSTAFTDTQYQMGPIYSCRIQTGASLATQRIWVGLAASALSASATPAVNCAAFRFDTGASDTKFQCYTSNGSTNTVTNSGVTVAASTTYDLVIDMSNASQILFYINGTLVGTNTTTLPGAATNLGPEMTITTLAATAENFSVGTMRLEAY